MRSAENVLGVIRERGKKGQPLEDIYRQLYNPNLYLLAYENLRSNAGVMTPGVTKETVDGMSMKKIQQIIEAVRHERYRWKPVRRTYIPKKSGKLRPLGLPTWSDKPLQEVMYLAYASCRGDAFTTLPRKSATVPQLSTRSHACRLGQLGRLQIVNRGEGSAVDLLTHPRFRIHPATPVASHQHFSCPPSSFLRAR
jgi:hypothetical protein